MKSIWINLPVKNVKKSKAFFEAIGFTPNPNYPMETSASFLIGEPSIVMMLFAEEEFKRFVRNEISDTKKGNEILLNIDAQSKEEVDTMANTVKKVGGTIFAHPEEVQGWMYAFGFEDLDGHRWSMLYMDPEKMPKM